MWRRGGGGATFLKAKKTKINILRPHPHPQFLGFFYPPPPTTTSPTKLISSVYMHMHMHMYMYGCTFTKLQAEAHPRTGRLQRPAGDACVDVCIANDPWEHQGQLSPLRG